MLEHCPLCDESIGSAHVTPEDGRPYEEWRHAGCDETWRHLEETVLDRSLDLNRHGDQPDRRDADANLD